MSLTSLRFSCCARTPDPTNLWLVAVFVALSPLPTDAQQPTPQQQDAIREFCRGDFQARCSGVPSGGAEALQCLKANFAQVSSGCQKALDPVMGSGAAASGGAPGSRSPASTPAAPTKSPPPSAAGTRGSTSGGQPASMRDELMLTREVCGSEFRSYCSSVQLGGGRALQCLEANAAQLSPRCRAALAEIRARR